MSSTGSSNKTQKTDHEGESGGGGSAASTTPLVKALLKEKGILRKIVEITSVSQTLRLLMTCKELLVAEKDVFENHKLPVVCDMSSNWLSKGNEFKLYRAMVGTPNSRWLKWLDTSEVAELKLTRHVTDEEMLIMFSGEKFSNLRTLSLYECTRVTDASVLEVARRCSNLQTLNLYECMRITDASLLEVARRCSNIQWLDLTDCSNITDASVMEVARRCSNLQTLSLRRCWRITSVCKNALRQSHPNLEHTRSLGSDCLRARRSGSVGSDLEDCDDKY